MSRDEMEWTSEERAALDALSRELEPGRLLEERTVRALRARGLLGRNRAAVGGRVGIGRSPAWWVAAVAAGLALFFGGLALGQARSDAAAYDLARALRTAESAERPSLIQQTGTLYVDALASLAASASGDPEVVGTGVEVGLAALYAASYELARLHPRDARLREVLRVLEAPPQEDGAADVHWF